MPLNTNLTGRIVEADRATRTAPRAEMTLVSRERQQSAREQFERAIAEHLNVAAFATEQDAERQPVHRERAAHAADERRRLEDEASLERHRDEVEALERRVQAS